MWITRYERLGHIVKFLIIEFSILLLTIIASRCVAV